MISVGKVGGQTVERITALYGLEQDVSNLPIDNIMNGSYFYAMDTHNLYMFDEENKIWIVQ